MVVDQAESQSSKKLLAEDISDLRLLEAEIPGRRAATMCFKFRRNEGRARIDMLHW